MENKQEYCDKMSRSDFKPIGKGLVSPEKVRVYHRLLGKLAPAVIKLDWKDEDSVPFVYYLDQKSRMQFGSSDERYPDLLNKIERIRFDYPHIWLNGRLWKKRKIIVLDKFCYHNRDSMYIFFREFLGIMIHYIEDINNYNLVFPKTENKGVVYMNSIYEVYEKCLYGFIQSDAFMGSPIGGRKNMFTGLSAIDKIVGELKPSELVVIAGRPGMGKTSLIVSMTNNLLINRIPIAFFSLGMTGVNIIDRLLAYVCHIRVGTFLNGQLTHEEWNELDNKIKGYLTSELYVDDSPELSLKELENKIIEQAEEHKVRIVMIDYLQLINCDSNNQIESLAKSLESMKELAKRLNVAIVVVSCLYQGKKVFRRFPKFVHHREFQTIRQFADWTFYIYRPDIYHSRLDYQEDHAVSVGHIDITNHHTKKSELAVLEYDKRCMRFNDLPTNLSTNV